jgi:hypothetical protein
MDARRAFRTDPLDGSKQDRLVSRARLPSRRSECFRVSTEIHSHLN